MPDDRLKEDLEHTPQCAKWGDDADICYCTCGADIFRDAYFGSED